MLVLTGQRARRAVVAALVACASMFVSGLGVAAPAGASAQPASVCVVSGDGSYLDYIARFTGTLECPDGRTGSFSLDMDMYGTDLIRGGFTATARTSLDGVTTAYRAVTQQNESHYYDDDGDYYDHVLVFGVTTGPATGAAVPWHVEIYWPFFSSSIAVKGTATVNTVSTTTGIAECRTVPVAPGPTACVATPGGSPAVSVTGVPADGPTDLVGTFHGSANQEWGNFVEGTLVLAGVYDGRAAASSYNCGASTFVLDPEGVAQFWCTSATTPASVTLGPRITFAEEADLDFVYERPRQTISFAVALGDGSMLRCSGTGQNVLVDYPVAMTCATD